MSSQSIAPPVSITRGKLWAGYAVSALPVLLMLMGGVMKILQPAPVIEGFAKLGYPEGVAVGIGILALFVTLLYLIPRTSVLGAILVTGYLGGATATHVRVGDPAYMPVVFGVMLWLGLYLREPRLHALVPLKSEAGQRPF